MAYLQRRLGEEREEAGRVSNLLVNGRGICEDDDGERELADEKDEVEAGRGAQAAAGVHTGTADGKAVRNEEQDPEEEDQEHIVRGRLELGDVILAPFVQDESSKPLGKGEFVGEDGKG